jgi:protein-disulfide isomerase
MYRRFSEMFFRRSIFLLLLICLGCAAQSAPPEIAKRIERQVRAFYNIPSNVKINLGPLKPSEFPNYDAMSINFDGGEKKQNYDFLLSKDGKTLLRMTKLDLTKDPYADVMKKIDVGGRPARGNKEAKVVAVNYDDFQCPFCSRMHQTLFPQMLKEYGDRVLFIYKDYPLSQIHPWAIHAAVDANCLSSQSNPAYWDFADYIHGNQDKVNSEKGRDTQFSALDRMALEQAQKNNLDLTKLQSCIKAQNDDAVKASMKEAESLGVEATPTMFVNGEKVDGALPANELRAVLDRALQQAGASGASVASTTASPVSGK